MQKVQKTYTPEFKREAVRLAQTSGKPIAQIARELGISDTSIHQWRKELTEHGPEAFPGSGHQTAKARGDASSQARTGDRQAGARYIKKSHKHLFARKTMRYQFIAQHRHEYPITLMCRVLEVSVSGFYAWLKRPPSRHSREDTSLAKSVKEVFQTYREVYGSPRVHAELQNQGIKCARKRVARLMREQELFAKRPRHRTVTTHSEPDAQVAPNLLQRDFSAEQPNTKWVADTTSIWTAEGWLYLAVVLDLFSRMVVGWSLAATQDATLVVQALRMAITRRRPQAGLLHHSDRGSTYTSESYQALLQQEGMVVSMSRTADCYDNAAMESFFHSLKGECLDNQSFQTRSQARSVTFDDIETFYNRTRRHSTLQYLSPLRYEQLMY